MKKKLLAGVATLIVIAAGSYFLWQRHIRPINTASDTETFNSQSAIDSMAVSRARGEALFKKRYYQTMVAGHQKVLNAAPNNDDAKKRLARAYYELAKIRKELGEDTAAAEDMKRALELDPNIAK